MNILLFSRICAKTGVGNHIKELSSELIEQGHSVWVVSGTNDIGIDDSIFHQIELPKLKLVTVFNVLRNLRSFILLNDIDVVHVHHRMAALYMRLYTLFWKIPVVYTLHLADIPSDFFHRVMTFPGDKAIGVSTDVSEFMKNKLKISARKIVTVLNGVDDKKLTPLSVEEQSRIKDELKVPNNRIVVTMHCRIDEVKNHLVLVEAINKLPKDIQNKLVVIVSGKQQGCYYEMIVSKIKEYGISDLFRFVGWCETRKILGISQFLILPSFNEGFPLSVCEAFLMKVPVMRTKTGGFVDQKYCYEIDSIDTKRIEDYLTDIAKNGFEDYKDNIELAYHFAKNNLTVTTMTHNVVDVYRGVINARK